jgi:Fe-S-cluster containining protein
LKKRKKRHGKKAVRIQTEPDILQDIRYLKPDDDFHFECSLCGECCRNVEQSVLLESFDLYRIACHLRRVGDGIGGIEDVIMAYADIKTLGDTMYPIFLLKTRGQKKECIFLKEGRCSIHEAKPRACRLYPLGAWPNDTLDGFDYFIASQKRHHFKGPALRAGDWMDSNFGGRDRAIALMDAKAAVELAPILRGLKNADVDRDRILQPLILFKYVCFELDEPFMPQFMRNMNWLKSALLSLIGEMK